MAKEPQIPNGDDAIVQIPYTVTMQGVIAVPANVPDAAMVARATVLSQLNASLSLAGTLRQVDCQTGAPGLAILKS